jgi:hypothetical protein
MCEACERLERGKNSRESRERTMRGEEQRVIFNNIKLKNCVNCNAMFCVQQTIHKASLSCFCLAFVGTLVIVDPSN